MELQSAEGCDALIMPGDYAQGIMRRHREMVDFVRHIDGAGRAMTAICHASRSMSSAGILRGRNATIFCSIRGDMVNASARWVDAEVVRSGNHVTSRKPDDLPAFCRAIIDFLTARQCG